MELLYREYHLYIVVELMRIEFILFASNTSVVCVFVANRLVNVNICSLVLTPRWILDYEARLISSATQPMSF